jgi:predicted transcriptional regulator
MTVEEQQQKSRQYRDRVDICIEILELCASPRLLTRILGLGNMRYSIGKELIEDLVRRGYLTESTYLGFHTTPSGLRALQKLQGAKNDIRSVLG